ncbi:hypothetical protein BCV70DRAFT_27423 [Testicularia cyperi]|uniref:RING-type domain-containing protein n=1 Tax=Testicularia cyperi TaxID=1882483 RepID=A0A317XL37_9BASI|nr:hypothetical protein BCV70DRAFT_27423 [Testicularia cyperi]
MPTVNDTLIQLSASSSLSPSARRTPPEQQQSRRSGSSFSVESGLGEDPVDLTSASSPPLPRPTVVASSSAASSRSSSRNTSSSSLSRPGSPSSRRPALNLDGLPTSSAQGRQRSHVEDRIATASDSVLPRPSVEREGETNRREPNTARGHVARRSIASIIEVSSDSDDDDRVNADDDDDEILAITPLDTRRVMHPDASTESIEISGVRRNFPIASTRGGILSPPPMAGQPALPVRMSRHREYGHERTLGISVDPLSGEFLRRPMAVVRPPRSSTRSDAILLDDDGDDSADLRGADVLSTSTLPSPQEFSARRERGDHPITEQRLRSTNLTMPTMSPPRSKPPPIEQPLLSKFPCPICFEAPTNVCTTPCGHLFCGDCLYQTLKAQAVQRGAMIDEERPSFIDGMFSLFTGAAPNFGQHAGTGPGTAADGSGIGGGLAGGATGTGGAATHRGDAGPGAAQRQPRSRKPDPLAGHCPVCRAKIKGAFNGREKGGVAGLRLMIGQPYIEPTLETCSTEPPGASAPRSMGNELEGDQQQIPQTHVSASEDEAVLPTELASPAAKREKIGGPGLDGSSRTRQDRACGSAAAGITSVAAETPKGRARRRSSLPSTLSPGSINAASDPALNISPTRSSKRPRR